LLAEMGIESVTTGSIEGAPDRSEETCSPPSDPPTQPRNTTMAEDHDEVLDIPDVPIKIVQEYPPLGTLTPGWAGDALLTRLVTVDDLRAELGPGPRASRCESKSIGELQDLGFEQFTRPKMQKEWNIGGDLLKDMAYRAMKDGHIHDDYQIITPKARPQLWARRKR
jgi:hypothetical protein